MNKFEIRVQKKKEPVKFKPVQLYEETHKRLEMARGDRMIEVYGNMPPAIARAGYKETVCDWCSDGKHIYHGNTDVKITDEISKAIAQLFIDGAVARTGKVL